MALTDREFWLNYWESHRAEIMVPVANSNLFSSLYDSYFQKYPIKSACELGGFPGSFSVYLKKKYGVEATLVDYVIPRDILSEFFKTNQLNDTDISVIEADIFNFEPQIKYDLVFSIGLIEHFENSKEIISIHLKYMAENSHLIILLPNFTGLNGWFQRKFDRANYDKHYIPSMNPTILKNILDELGLKNTSAGYLGKFGIWLERENQQPSWVRIFKKAVWFTGKVITKIIPVDSKLFSPYIVITASK